MPEQIIEDPRLKKALSLDAAKKLVRDLNALIKQQEEEAARARVDKGQFKFDFKDE